MLRSTVLVLFLLVSAFCVNENENRGFRNLGTRNDANSERNDRVKNQNFSNEQEPTNAKGVTSNDNHQNNPTIGDASKQLNPTNSPSLATGGNKKTGDKAEKTNQSKNSTTSDNDKNSINKNKDEEEEEDKEVCFRRLGCFSMGKPWKSVLRPIRAPLSPEEIQTTLIFYSRQNQNDPVYKSLHPNIDIEGTSYDKSKRTVVIVHGFANSGNATWMSDMKDAYLKRVDANVILVDWGKGAQLFNYLQVAGNTRVVGRQLALFVNYLITRLGATPKNFHLIGHSLGAHICSYLAKDIPGIARLTALDPAQPGFEGFEENVRLDENDADFVDVIHTDAKPLIPTLGFGMITPQGHVDFYMNGGFEQPGCVLLAKDELPVIKNILDLAKWPVEYINKVVSCPHGRAYEYFTESLNQTECTFWGHKAELKNIVKSVANTVTQGLLKKVVALSPHCSKEDCIPLGLNAVNSPLRGVFVVTTSKDKPFCNNETGILTEIADANKSIAKKVTKTLGKVI